MFEPQHPSIANISLSGDTKAATALLPRGRALLAQLQEKLKLGGIQSGRAERYTQGGHIEVTQAMGVAKIHLRGGVAGAPKRGEVAFFYPDIASGLLLGGNFYPSATTAARFTEGTDIKQLPHSGTLLPATVHSGALKKVVQFCRGYGRASGALWEYLQSVEEGGKAPAFKPYPLYFDTPDFGFSFAYSSGLAFSAGGAPWLIGLSKENGVLAGPLPLHPMTCGKYFARCRAYFAAKQAADMLEMLDWLGGLPTGEGIPDDDAVDYWLDSGLGVQVEEASFLAPLLEELEPFHELMGFAFNQSGSEAHQTAYSEDEDTGERTACHYKLTLQDLPDGNLPDPSDAQGALLAHIKQYTDSYGSLGRVLIGKTRFFDGQAIGQLLQMSAWSAFVTLANAVVEVDYPPIKAQLLEVAEGKLAVPLEPPMPWPGSIAYWNYDSPQYQPKPQPLDFASRFGLCFAQHYGSASPKVKAKVAHSSKTDDYEPSDCDTTFFVYFEGDALVEVKWKLTVRAWEAPDEQERDALIDQDTVPEDAPEDEELALCYFGEHEDLAGAEEGIDPKRDAHIAWSQGHFQGLWQEAGFHWVKTYENGTEEEGSFDCVQQRTDFQIEVEDPEAEDSGQTTQEVKDRGYVIMRESPSVPSLYQVRLIQVEQTLYWREDLKQAFFYWSPLAREAFYLSKAQQEIRLPMRYYNLYGVVNPYFGVLKPDEDIQGEGIGPLHRRMVETNPYTLIPKLPLHCTSSQPQGQGEGSGEDDGWSWIDNHEPPPFIDHEDGTFDINPAALIGHTPPHGIGGSEGATGFRFWQDTQLETVEQGAFRRDGNPAYRIPQKGLLHLRSGALAGEIEDKKATPDSLNEILGESCELCYLNADLQAADEWQSDPQTDFWVHFFSPEKCWKPSHRIQFMGASSWNSAWNCAGEDATRYVIEKFKTTPPFYRWVRRGGSGFAAGSAVGANNAVFIGVNP